MSDALEINQDTQWVVKSSSKILGPFTTEEIFEQIKEKSIIAIDELIPEFGNWSYVRDIEIFRNELAKSKAMSPAEVTKTQPNVTESLTDQFTSTGLMEETEELSSFGDIDRTNPNPEVQPLKTSELPRPTAHEALHKKPSRGFNSILIPALLSGLVIIGGFYLFNQWSQNINKKPINEDQLSVDAQLAYASGHYKDAYKKFQDLNRMDLDDLPQGFYVQLAALVLNQERQTVYARDILEKSSDQVKESPEWLSTMGLAHLIDQDFSAAEKFLLKSINKNPQFLPAWMNLGHSYLNQKRYQEAWNYFYSAYLRGYSEGHVTVFMAVSLIEQWKINRDKDLLVRAKDLISNFLSTTGDRRDLNQILKIWLELKTDRSYRQNASLDLLDFVQADPYLPKQFKLNPYEYNFERKSFEAYCSGISQAFNQKDILPLLFSSLCNFKLGFVGPSVEQPMAKAESLYPKETLVYAVKSVILDQMGEAYQKSLLIGRALSSDSKREYTLPLILQARFCENKKDYSCATKYWKQVYDRQRLEIGSYSGFAHYFMNKKEYKKAQAWIDDGLLLSPSYKPLLKMNIKLKL